MQSNPSHTRAQQPSYRIDYFISAARTTMQRVQRIELKALMDVGLLFNKHPLQRNIESKLTTYLLLVIKWDGLSCYTTMNKKQFRISDQSLFKCEATKPRQDHTVSTAVHNTTWQWMDVKKIKKKWKQSSVYQSCTRRSIHLKHWN
jgi:hypothetical protein